MGHACDLCSDQAATVYCKNDEAYLCRDCDFSLHMANPLSYRHERVDLVTSTPVSNLAPAHAPEPAALPVALPVDDLEPLDYFVSLAQEQAAREAAPRSQPAAIPAPPALKQKVLGPDSMLLGSDEDLFEQCFGSLLEGADSGALLFDSSQDGVVPTMSFFDAHPVASPPQQIPAGAPSAVPSSTSYSFSSSTTGSIGKEVPTAARQQLAQHSMMWDVQDPLGDGTSSEDLQDDGPLYVPNPRGPRVSKHKGEKRRRRPVERVIRYPSRKAYADIRPRIKGRFATQAEWDAMRAAGTL